jgi:autotransporter-associated beta strand protein
MCHHFAGAASYYFDVNGTAAGSGVTDGGSFAFANNWSTDATGNSATGAAATRSPVVFSAGTDAANKSYTVTGTFGQISSGVTVEEGFVTLTGGGAFYNGQTVKTYSGTGLTITNTTWDFYNNTVTFDVAASTTVFLNNIGTTSGRAGNVTKVSPGLLLVSDAATARGIIVLVTNGEMRIQNGNAMYNPAYPSPGKTYTVTITNTGTLELSSNITVANNPITISGSGYNNLGAIANYAGNNSYNSLITLNGDSRINNNANGTTLTLKPASGSAITGAYGLTLGGTGSIIVGASVDAITSLTLDGTISVLFTNGSALTSSPNINVGAGTVFDASPLGTLTLGGSQSLGGSGTVNGSVATSSGSVIQPGGNLTVGTLTITTNLTLAGNDTLKFDFPSSSTNDVIIVGGDLTPNATAQTTIALTTLPLAGLTTGNYVLFQVSGALNGDPTNFTVSAASSQTFSIQYDTVSSPKRVLLHVTGSVGPQSLVWQGGQNANAWDLTGTTTNWLNVASPAVFYSGDNVSFTDAGAANQPVINAFVTPGSLAVTVNSPNAYTFSGTGGIIGPTGLIKNGNGSLTLATANTYTGSTVVSNGTLIFVDGGSVAGVITNHAMVEFNLTSAAVTFTNPISGSGSLADNGGGNVTLTAPVSLGGILSDSASGNFTLSGALTVNGIVTNSGNATLTLGNVTINGGGGIANLGGGTITLAGTSTYTGGTLIASGTVQVGNGVTGTLGSGAITNNGALVLNSGQNFSIADVISGSGSVTQNGTNTVTLLANTYDGATAINAGSLVASNANSLGSTVGGTTIGGGTSTASLGLMGNITLAPEAITLSGRQGAGTYAPHIVNLSGTNTIPGNITGATGGGNCNVQSAAGLLILSGSFSQSATTATRPLDLQGAGNGLWSGSIINGSTTVSLAKYDAGTWTLAGTNTFTGATTINGGALALGGTGSISNTPSITLSAGTVFDVSANSFALGSSQSLIGNGAVNGNFATTAGSQILPGGSGAVGTLTFSNNLNLSGGETFKFDFPNAGSNDLIVVLGDLNPTASPQTTISLATLPVTGYLTNGDYVLFQVSGNLNGTAADFTVSAPAARQSYQVVYDTGSYPKRVLLRISVAPALLVWQGGQNANAWDIGTTPNWLNGVASDNFYNGDSVRFTDAGAANPPVLNSGVNPGSVTFSNNLPNDYTLSGSAAITGPGALTKFGSGGLTISNTNSYNGGTVINAGTVSLGVVNALGSAGSIDFTGNSTLQWNGPTNDLSARLKIEDGVTTTLDTTGSTVALGTTVQLGSLKTAALTKKGSGQLTVSGNQSFTGPLTISEGIVKMAGNKTLATNINLALAASTYLYLDGSSLYFDQVNGSGTIGMTSTTAGTDTLTVGGANGSSQFDGGIVDSTRKIAVTKSGTGTFTLTGASSYTGSTTVSNGTLVVNGSLGSGVVTVMSNATLAGIGTIGGAVTTKAGSTLAPGTNGIGTLTINNNFTNAGNLVIKLDKSLVPAQSNDFVNVSGALTNSGTGILTVTNIGSLALAAGDTFPVFNAALANGNALTIAGPPGVTFTNNLALDGTIGVLSAFTTAVNPTNITYSINGNVLNLSWPADHLGWLVQSNSVNLAVPADWYDISNTAAGTNYGITIDATKPNVFYRLRKP